MNTFTKDNFNYDGMYLTYNLKPGQHYGNNEFVARFNQYAGFVMKNVEEANSDCSKPKYKFYERLDFLWRLPYEIFFK